MDFLQSKRWSISAEREEYTKTWVGLLAEEYGNNLLDSVSFLAKKTIKFTLPYQKDAHRTLQNALIRADAERFLHWELAFPNVFGDDTNGGFDAVIGNPPWDRMKLQTVEWSAERRPEVAMATRAADRKILIADLQVNADPLWLEYCQAAENAEIASRVARQYGDYPLLSCGDINLYSLFVERASQLVKPTGIVGLITPSGIAADLGAAPFLRTLSETGRLAALYDFENKKVFFPDIHSNIKFCMIAFCGIERQFTNIKCAFFLEAIEELEDSERIINISPQSLKAINPNTSTIPVFRRQKDVEILSKIYSNQPVLINNIKDPPNKVWPLRYMRMFDMTIDSKLFMARELMNEQGWYPIDKGQWKKGDSEAVPLYVGRMIWHYDHRAASVGINYSNVHVATITDEVTEEQKQNTDYAPSPQYWVAKSDLPDYCKTGWHLGFRGISNPTNSRTLIASIVPGYAAGNRLAFFIPKDVSQQEFIKIAPLILANLNSMVLDYVTRIKMQWTNLNWYIVEQLPIIKPEQFESLLSHQNIADYIRAEVLHLTYTAHDLAPFARDMGYINTDGSVKPPIVWNATDRLHRQCRLDALFFNLYGINRDDAAYILDQFPIVARQDQTAHGKYLTKELILAYMNAVKVGDFTTVIAL